MTVTAFRRWLEKHPRMLFQTSSDSCCPVAKYLGKGANVATEKYWPPGRSHDKKMLRLPEWARRFVAAFDSLGVPGYFDGRRALKVLLRSSYRGG